MKDPCDTIHSRTRRRFLTTAGAASVLGFAGCAQQSGENDGSDGTDSGDSEGSGGNGETESDSDSSGGSSGKTLRIGTSSTGSATYSVAQGVSAVVNENSDAVSVEALPSDGSEANIGRLRNDEIEFGQFSSWTANHIVEGKDPYAQLPYTLQKVVHVQGSQWLFCAPANSDLESMGDIGPNTRVSPAHQGTGARPALERALSHLSSEFNMVSINFTSQAGPMQEGRLDVGVVPVINKELTGSYIDELKNTLDIRILTWPDSLLQKIKSDPLISMADVPMSNFDGYADTPDVAKGVLLDYGWAAKKELGADAVTAFLRAAFENREALTEYHPVLEYWQKPEYWVDGWEMPFHAGATAFYEEEGLL